MILSILLIAVFLFSLCCTYSIRSYALKHLLDIPNQRSSHKIPTPRGGGLSIVAAFYLFTGAVFFLEMGETKHLIVLSTGMLIAGIGFWDDHQHIAVRWRFLVHMLAAVTAVLLLQGLPVLQFGQQVINFGLPGYIIGVVALIWSLNLFNFMDGIDGIAASEAIFVAAALAGFIMPIDNHLAVIAAGLAVSCLGFLLWNRPPAKIFMGDVGSGFLGFVLGLLILVAAHKDTIFVYIGLILFAVFISDATYTLCYRIIDRQQWYSAHCSHAYQHAAKFYGHSKVVLAVWAINLLWLLPLAMAVYQMPEYGWPLLIVAYVPLVLIAAGFSAGKPYSV